MASASFALLFTILLMIGGLVLQFFLSRRKNRWFGLILPAITFVYSLLTVFSLASYVGMSSWKMFSVVVITFLTSNIPTIILMGIYLGCRERLKVRAQIDKMNIQDLD